MLSCILTLDLPSLADIFMKWISFHYLLTLILMRMSFLKFFLFIVYLYFLTAFFKFSLYIWISIVYFDKCRLLIYFYSACFSVLFTSMF